MLTPTLSLIRTGVGKTNAGAALAAALASSFATQTPSLLINLGVAGSLPPHTLAIGDSILATTSLYADEGIETPDSFLTPERFGFPYAPAPFADAGYPLSVRLRSLLAPLATHQGPIATVSTCAGTDTRAELVRQRTAALAEAMEGAAIAQVAAHRGIPFAELRVISNTTGDRLRQRWNLALSLERLAEVAQRLRGIDFREPT